jgi:hypothetical protein
MPEGGMDVAFPARKAAPAEGPADETGTTGSADPVDAPTRPARRGLISPRPDLRALSLGDEFG